MSDATRNAEVRIRSVFANHGVFGALHALDLGTGAEVAVAADEPVVLASVFKVPLVLTLLRAQDEGRLDLEQALELGPERTAGPTGTAAMLDPARLSLRDLAYLALAVSDNAAADALLDLVGQAAVTRTLSELGLTRLAIRHACRDFAATMLDDLGLADVSAIEGVLLEDPSLLDALQVRDPGKTNAGTAAEVTRLLAMIWRDQAASPQACAALRRLLRLQVWPHRLASGFPDQGVAVAAKTGTLPGLRNDVGVVEDSDQRAFAVAVFTVADNATPGMPQIDALIGATARIAVDALR